MLDKYFLHADPHSDPFDTIEKRIMVMLDLHQGIDRKTFVDSSNLYIYFIDALYLLNPEMKDYPHGAQRKGLCQVCVQQEMA